jgi:hypothetical protein
MSALQTLLTDVRRQHPRALGSSVVTIAALFVVLRWASKRSSDADVQLLAAPTAAADSEYDVIVVGGGASWYRLLSCTDVDSGYQEPLGVSLLHVYRKIPP